MRKLLVPLIVALAGCMSATAEARTSSPTVLVLPGGGWQVAEPAGMEPVVADLRAHGIRARAIGYPLGSPLIAEVTIGEEARRIPGPVILYGLSAGGTTASALAATGEVAGAVNVEGPVDLARWVTPFGMALRAILHLSTAELKSSSPYWRLGPKAAPQLILCGRQDYLVGCVQSAMYARLARRHQRDTTFRVLPGGHELTSSAQVLARRWILRRWGS